MGSMIPGGSEPAAHRFPKHSSKPEYNEAEQEVGLALPASGLRGLRVPALRRARLLDDLACPPLLGRHVSGTRGVRVA
eukprot:6342520-Alexandrium_andersonii.AAC.1